MTLLLFFFVLTVLVLVHELGHFIAAKKAGVKVEEFGFGLPPRLLGIKKGETLYSINAIPFGGFVKLFGEEYHEIKKKTESKKAFINKTTFQKFLIITAGVIGNFLLAWVLFSYLFTQGVPVPLNKIIVNQVAKNSPAEKAGLLANDYITSLINSKNETIKLTTSDQLIKLSSKYSDQLVQLEVLRGDHIKKISIIPRKNPPQGQGPLGIAISSLTEKKYPWYQAPFQGLFHTINMTGKIISELSKLFLNLLPFYKEKVAIDITGPIGIAKYASYAYNLGINPFVELMAVLSINLAIINILPFPALDGGRLIFIIYEAVSKRKINKNIEKYTNFIGFLILISLGILISIKDIIKLIR